MTTYSPWRDAWLEHYLVIPKGCHIHHIDGDRFNNNILNLECLTPKQHGARHSEMNRRNNPDTGQRKISKAAMELRSILSAQMRYWMNRCNMKVKQLAALTEVSEKNIYRYLGCDIGATTDGIAALAEAFGIPPAMLLTPIQPDNGTDE